MHKALLLNCLIFVALCESLEFFVVKTTLETASLKNPGCLVRGKAEADSLSYYKMSTNWTSKKRIELPGIPELPVHP